MVSIVLCPVEGHFLKIIISYLFIYFFHLCFFFFTISVHFTALEVVLAIEAKCGSDCAYSSFTEVIGFL